MHASPRCIRHEWRGCIAKAVARRPVPRCPTPVFLVVQAEVVRAFGDSEGPPWRHSLFGNPSDAETLRRRTTVAEELAERHFDLAFRIIYDFRLPGAHTRAGGTAGEGSALPSMPHRLSKMCTTRLHPAAC